MYLEQNTIRDSSSYIVQSASLICLKKLFTLLAYKQFNKTFYTDQIHYPLNNNKINRIHLFMSQNDTQNGRSVEMAMKKLRSGNRDLRLI